MKEAKHNNMAKLKEARLHYTIDVELQAEMLYQWEEDELRRRGVVHWERSVIRTVREEVLRRTNSGFLGRL